MCDVLCVKVTVVLNDAGLFAHHGEGVVEPITPADVLKRGIRTYTDWLDDTPTEEALAIYFDWDLSPNHYHVFQTTAVRATSLTLPDDTLGYTVDEFGYRTPEHSSYVEGYYLDDYNFCFCDDPTAVVGWQKYGF